MKRNFYFILFLFNVSVNNSVVCSDKFEWLAEAAKNCGEKLGSTLGSIAGVAGVVTIVKFGKEIVAETKEYFKPSHERQLKNTTQEMNKCLHQFQAGPKDKFNMPSDCRRQLDSFERLAGPIAIHKVRKAYAKNA